MVLTRSNVDSVAVDDFQRTIHGPMMVGPFASRKSVKLPPNPSVDESTVADAVGEVKIALVSLFNSTLQTSLLTNGNCAVLFGVEVSMKSDAFFMHTGSHGKWQW